MFSLPNLHPAVVHFPVVLIPLALLLDLAAVVKPSAALHRLVAGTWMAAAIAATVAFLAGHAAADGLVDVPALVQPHIGEHSDWATRTLVVACVVAGLRAASLAARPWATGPRWLALVGGVALGGLILVTADKGGALVYQHALAVSVPDCLACTACPECPPPGGSPPAGSVALVDVNGVPTWTPGPPGLAAWPEQGVGASGSGTVLFPPTFGDVQVNAWVDLSRFAGEIALLHHVDGDREGAFVVSTDGAAALVQGGEALDGGTVAAPGRLALAVSAAGSHYKGMVDGKLVVHGHAPALPAGRVGLRLEGEGVVVIEKLEVVPLEGH